MKRLLILLWIPVLMLTGCDDFGRNPKANQPVECPPLPVVDGYVTVKTLESDLTLKLPEYVDIIRDSRRGCQFAVSAYVDYLWYEGKLIPERINRFKVKVPADKKIHVLLAPNLNGTHLTKDIGKATEAWRSDPALHHKYFPLEFYPRWYWDGPETASERSRLDHVWGITGTRYKDPFGKPFKAFCDIPPVDSSRPDSRVEGPFAKVGDSKCRGWVVAIKNEKTLRALIDVWAVGAPEINHIYDTAVEQLQSFIQE